MNENEQRLTDIYRAVIAEGGVEATQYREAMHEVAAQVQPLIDSGEIVPDTLSWVGSVLAKVDKAEKNSTDEVLAAIARGEDDLSLDTPAHLDRVVCLGGGRRKVYRFLTAVDFDEMDEVRHRNVRSVNRAYHKEWRPKYAAWRVILRRNLTLGDAVQAGDLPVVAAELFAS